MSRRAKTNEQVPSLVITDLAQVRALGDPKKLRLLDAFTEPRTTLEVAARLGEAPTGLYRHVNALHRLRLLRIVRERPRRGTVERTFQAVARRFVIGEQALGRRSAAQTAVHRLFREAETAFFAACPEGKPKDGQTSPFAAGIQVSGSRAELARLRRRIVAMAEECARGRSSGKDTAFALLVFAPHASTDPTDPVDDT
ncbi:MAG: helix-turn-helix domain-containing protein [Gemmatimonadales bacterium]